MPNPIIQNYLNDESIPSEKRKKLFDALESGGANEAELASEITKRFGDSYQPQSRRGPDGGEMSVMEFLEKQSAGPAPYQKPVRGPMNNPGKSAVSQDGTLKNRIINAFKSTGSTIKEGASDVGVGVEEIKGASTREKMAMNAIADAKKKLASGKIDQGTYDKLISYSQKMMKDSSGTKNLGLSNVVKGTVKTGLSPITGPVSGALKPEFDKLGEKISGGIEGMSDENKAKLNKYMGKLSEMAKDHPALKNYLTAGLDLVGVGVGSKTIKTVAGATVKGIKTITPSVASIKNGFQIAKDMGSGVKDLAGKGLSDAGKLVDGSVGLVKKGGEKLKGISVPGKQSNIDLATDLLRPNLTPKNIRVATSQGLYNEGSKKLFSGSKDTINLTPRMEKVKVTLSNYFPDLKNTQPSSIPTKISQSISGIAKPLQSTFQKIEVPQKMKTSLKEAWQKLKVKQKNDITMHSDVKKVQTKFEGVFNKIMSQNLKATDGTFRRQNINDLWDAVKAFDKEVGNPIKEAVEKVATEGNISMQKAWLQSRKLLREAMDSVVDNMDDVNAKKAFQEMSDLYEAQSHIIKNIKATNSTGTSKAGDVLRNYKKELATALGVGTVASTLN